MPDFWRHSGYHLTARDAAGACLVTDDLLRAYIARPEVAPMGESCARERALFERLLRDPRATVDAGEIAALADADARDSYAIVLRFRDHLVASGTLEAAYRTLFVAPDGTPADFSKRGLPALFADQLAQMIVRNLLEGCDDAFQARAGELFFREQRAHVGEGQVLLADKEAVDDRSRATGDDRFGNLGRLIAQAQTPLRAVEFDVLNADNANDYWLRDEKHDMALAVGFGRPGLAALCRVIERWLAHFFAVRAVVEPVRSIERARMRWYVGLDAASTALLNDIYNDRVPDENDRRRLLCMMHMRVSPDPAGAAAANRCYLALAMNDAGVVRMKPQNLLTGLPAAGRW